MTDEPSPEQHTPLTSLVLHLLPGVLVAAGYFALTPVLSRHGFPSIAALMASSALILVPVEFGYLLYQGRRLNGRLSLRGVVSYGDRLSVGQYLLGVPALFLVLGIVFSLMKPLDNFLLNALFSWVPTIDAGLSAQYGWNQIVITYGLVAVFGVITGPLVEELYFRGHLLPRMGYAGKWAPLIHGLMFGLYHLWTAWMLLTRMIGTLPLAWAAQKKSLHLSVATHMAVNSVDLIIAIAFIAQLAKR